MTLRAAKEKAMPASLGENTQRHILNTLQRIFSKMATSNIDWRGEADDGPSRSICKVSMSPEASNVNTGLITSGQAAAAKK